MLPFQIKSASKYFLMEKFSILIQNCIILWIENKYKKNWCPHKYDVVLLFCFNLHLHIPWLHFISSSNIPLNSSDTNSSSNIKSKMHLCENECEHGTFHLIWVFREHHIHYLLFAIFLDCGVDEMYNSWAALQILQAMNGALQSFRSYYCKEIVCT